MTDLQYQAVYNVLSFALASMMATTMYLWFRSTAVPGCLQCLVFRACEHDGHHHVSLVPFNCSAGQVQKRGDHLRVGDLHCCVSLHPDLQFLGERILIPQSA